MSIRAVLIGEQNPYGSDPRYALYPYPPNCAGHRLQKKILGVSEREYIRDFARVNLCSGPWVMADARKQCDYLVRAWHVDATFVLLGTKVASAFGLAPTEPFTTRVQSFAHLSSRDRRVVFLPHPSGRCRLWNGPESFERARAVLREAGVLTPSSAPPALPRE